MGAGLLALTHATRRAASRGWSRRLPLVLPLAYGLCDYGENAAIAVLVLGGPDGGLGAWLRQ